MKADTPPADETPPRSSRSRARDARALLVLAVAIVVVFAPVLFFGRVLFVEDIGMQHYPWQVYLARARLQGDWLPCAPELAGGDPFWANGQSGAFYPLNLLFMLPLDSAWLFGLVTALNYAIAATGMFLLARWFGLRRDACLASGLTFALTGFMAAHSRHLPVIAAAAWLPWAAFGLLAWVYGRKRWGIALSAVAFAFVALNHVQIVYYACAFAVGCLIVAGRVRPYPARLSRLRRLPGTPPVPGGERLTATTLAGETPAPRATGSSRLLRFRSGGKGGLPVGRAMLAFVLALAAGLLVAAVQLVPVWGMVRAGCGAARSGGDLMLSGSLPVGGLLALILPDIHGPWWQFHLPGGINHWELCGYPGSVALCLVLLVRVRDPRHRRMFIGLGIMAALGLILALGGRTPVYSLLRFVPLMDRFRIAGRWLLLWNASFALIIGLVVHDLRSRLRQRVFGALLALATAILAAAALIVSTQLDAEARSDAIGLAVGLGFVSAAIWLTRPGFSRAQGASAVIVAAITVQAVAFACYYNPTDSPYVFSDGPLVAPLRSLQSEFGRCLCIGHAGAYETPGVRGLSAVLPDASLLHGLRTADVYDPMTPPTADALERIVERGAPDSAAAAQFGIDLLAAPSANGPPPGNWERCGEVYDATIYRNRDYRGLAWTEGGARSVHCSMPSRGRYRFEVADGAACSLTTTVTRLPGWTATVNGEPAPISTVGAGFIAVQVPGGPCTVELRYAPAGIRLGAILSALGALIIAISCLLPRKPLATADKAVDPASC